MCRQAICWVMLVAFGLVAVPSVTHAQVENLLLNPSFEEDEAILDDPAWEQWCTWGYESGLPSTVEIDETEAADGNRSLRVNPVGETNWYFIVLYDPFSADLDKNYTVSFWAKAEEARPLTVQMKASDNSVDAWGATSFELTTDWAEYTYTSNVLHTNVKLEILCSGSTVPFWLDFVYVYEGEYVPGIGPSGAASPGKAARPDPADGTIVDETDPELNWRPGAYAVSHQVYFGENSDDVAAGAVEPTATTEASLDVTSQASYAAGLTPGQTYYWRVDEVNDADPNSPWTGDVWSFRVRPLTAWNPTPADGIQYVHPDQELTWEPGLSYIFHQVFFGETFEEVESATGMGYMTLEPIYDPPPLEIGKTYYWRVDEFTGAIEHRGDIWSFTTLPDIAVTDPDLLGWWTLDEGMGTTAVDWSGHGSHGRILGSAEWTYGVQNGALYLAGGANVEIPALNVETNTVTMTAWVKRDSSQADWAGVLFSREGSAVSGMGFGAANELRYHWTDQAWDFATGIVPPDQEWFFMALVVEPTRGTVYYNGTGTFARNQAAHDPDPFDGALRIGQDSQGGRDLQGTVDDVRFYNKALSEAEIMEVMRGDPLLAWDPTPAPDAVMDIRDVSSLRWSAGDTAASHDVYLGASREAVAAAAKDSAEYQGNQTATSLSLSDLVEIGGGDYYWRIDEVEADGATVHTGRIWKFSVLSYLVVDDFESYTDDYEAGEAIFQTWIDGEQNNTGSTVGYWEAPFAETRIVHGGGQSMPLQYDNTTGPGYSDGDRTFSPAQDWTQAGVTTLVVHFRGAPDNAGQLYVKINGTKVPYDGDPADIASSQWIAWDIDLASVGVSLTKVTTLTIGVEGGQTGVVYVDDIWLTKP